MATRIMLDTSFVISLLNAEERNHAKAESYFRFFVSDKIDMLVSPIVFSECDMGQLTALLPERLFIFPPFNGEHGSVAREIGELLRQRGGNPTETKVVVKDDTKIIGQALSLGVEFLIASDKNMIARCEWLRKSHGKSLRGVDLNDEFSVRYFRPDGQDILPGI
jgi:hypothetical protein